jgi:hypothetical protein
MRIPIRDEDCESGPELENGVVTGANHGQPVETKRSTTCFRRWSLVIIKCDISRNPGKFEDFTRSVLSVTRHLWKNPEAGTSRRGNPGYLFPSITAAAGLADRSSMKSLLTCSALLSI